MNREEAAALLERGELVCSAEEVGAAVTRLAREITARLKDEFPMVLAVMGGAVIFTGQLLPLLAFPLEFGAIEVTRYPNTTRGRDIDWRLAPKDDVRGRTVLVIDDILDEGVTLAAVRDRLLAMGARQVLTAVFADKDLGREKPVAADFVGVRVPDRYVFGFGMDAYGLWRNLPAVYALGGMTMLAIIGGSGLTQLSSLEVARKQIVRTPYGEPSGPIAFGRIAGGEVAFLARHGYGHTLAPHEINYPANLWALREKGVTRILAVCTVGGIAPALAAGALVIPDQIIDYTWGRKSTYFEGAEKPVTHVDFTHPYCETTRSMLIEAAADAGVAIVARGTYAAVQGPRLETAAEVNRLERDGADLVGMTGMPEAALARELEIAYASIAVVANPAAGRGSSAQAVSLEEIARVLAEAMERVRRVVEKVVERNGRS